MRELSRIWWTTWGRGAQLAALFSSNPTVQTHASRWCPRSFAGAGRYIFLVCPPKHISIKIEHSGAFLTPDVVVHIWSASWNDETSKQCPLLLPRCVVHVFIGLGQQSRRATLWDCQINMKSNIQQGIIGAGQVTAELWHGAVLCKHQSVGGVHCERLGKRVGWCILGSHLNYGLNGCRILRI